MKVGLVGSGKIASEYAKVIKSFNHDIHVLVTKNNSFSKKKLLKKFHIPYEATNFHSAIKNYPNVNFWIICGSPENLFINLKIAIKNNIKFLIEKSILANSKELTKLILKKNIENCHIAYNRNFFDFIPSLIKNLKKDNPQKITINMADPYSDIIDKKGKKFRKNLVKFMTSHWIALIFKILENLNYKIDIKSKMKYFSKGYLGHKFLFFVAKKSKKKILINFNLIPNNPSNTSVSFLGLNKNIILKPIEKMTVFSGIKKKVVSNQNTYKPIYKIMKTGNKFKPGFKLMYKSFFEKVILNKKNNLSINLNDLINIYIICEIFEKDF